MKVASNLLLFCFLGLSGCVTTPQQVKVAESATLTVEQFNDLKRQAIKVTDINQSRPGKPSVITFHAFDGREVLDKVFGSRKAWTDRSYLNYECLDGYVSIMETKSLLQGQFYFAFARADQKDFTLINYAKDGKKTSLGPFYIVWSDEATSIRDKAHFWPYQVVKLQIQ